MVRYVHQEEDLRESSSGPEDTSETLVYYMSVPGLIGWVLTDPDSGKVHGLIQWKAPTICHRASESTVRTTASGSITEGAAKASEGSKSIAKLCVHVKI